MGVRYVEDFGEMRHDWIVRVIVYGIIGFVIGIVGGIKIHQNVVEPKYIAAVARMVDTYGAQEREWRRLFPSPGEEKRR